MSRSKPIILMYHLIVQEPSDLPLGREVGANLYDVSLDNFEQHMRLLKYNGYSTPTQLSLSPKNVTITFDDGEMNNFTHAFRVLLKHNFTAYFFIIVERVGTPGYMNWAELKQMQDAGMIIGSHGLSHEIMTEMSAEVLERELIESKKALEKNLGGVIDTISIPRGFYNDSIVRKAQENGYKMVFVSQKNTDGVIECWPRIDVQSKWSIKRFQQAVQGKTPLSEQFTNIIKGMLKKSLGSKGYNELRGKMVGGKSK